MLRSGTPRSPAQPAGSVGAEPSLSTARAAPVIAEARLRGGKGWLRARRSLAGQQTIGIARACGANGPITLRGDSGSG